MFARALLLSMVLLPAAALDVFFTLMVAIDGTGSGRVVGTGIDCPPECTSVFHVSYPPTLTAIPDAGSFFVGWSGWHACPGEMQATLARILGTVK